MKALFLIFHGFAAHNGISKKIFYQVEAMRGCGVDTQLCYLSSIDGGHYRMIDDTVLQDFGCGVVAKIRKRCCYGRLTEHILTTNIRLVYIRSVHNANPFINQMVSKLHRHGVTVVMEIPTYPYEKQFEEAPLQAKVQLMIDIAFRLRMAKSLDRIVTFSDDKVIFGVQTIEISNGIDFSQTSVKQQINDTSKVLRLVGVAQIHSWHGFDRLLEGLGRYYSVPRDYKVIFNIVGEGMPAELAKLHAIVERYGLSDSVIFHGALSGDKLDNIFDQSDMGIASLARHRSGITKIKPLKNREYAARGIPFAYSESDDDFDTMPYVMRVPADESPIDIEAVVVFYRQNSLSAQQIRHSITQTLSWSSQMQKVIDQSPVK